MSTQFTLPPDTRTVGTGDPPADMNGVVDALTAAGVPYNVLNAAWNGGADPAGVNDSTTAINEALTACGQEPGGGTVFMPWGEYRISGPLIIPPYVFLEGQGNITLPLVEANVQNSTRIHASSGWAPGSAAGMVEFLSQTPGGWSVPMEHAGLRNIVLDASASTFTAANLNGIYFTGPCYDIRLTDVFINSPGHDGIQAAGYAEPGITPTFPYHHYYERVTAYQCQNTGFNLANFTDSTFSQTMAFGCQGSGWVLSNVDDSIFTACRAQWNISDGFQVGNTDGHVIFTGCETDNNGACGWLINSAAGTGGAITLSGCVSEGDGQYASGGTAALKITGCVTPVVISAFTEGIVSRSGVESPRYGLEVGTSGQVMVTGSYFEGATAGFQNDGTNTNLVLDGVIAGTGTLGSLTYVTYGQSGAFLCAPSQYAPGSQTQVPVSATSLAAWDSGVICTNSFIAPASGSVVVGLSCASLVSSAGAEIGFALAAVGQTSPQYGKTFVTQGTASTLSAQLIQFYVTGLSAGTSYQFDLLGAVSTGTATIYANGVATVTLKGAPVVMTVQAV